MAPSTKNRPDGRSVHRGGRPATQRRGHPLPPALRSLAERLFGQDFADVRIVVGPQAQRLGALAFTSGSDIYFAPGQYDPTTPEGLRLLGHELAHVVQQRQGRVRNPYGYGLAVVHDAALEREADHMGLALQRAVARARPGS
jgi:hypothetical protein